MKQIIILLLSVFSLCQCSKDSNNENPGLRQETKILFVGNSYTYYNQGVDFHLENLLERDTLSDEMKYVINSVTVGGYTLEKHWSDTASTNKIMSDNWDYVVLQEQSTRPINNIDLFYQYARSFNNEITNIHSETVFYMTWARKDKPLEISVIDNAYSTISNELQTKLAPVGRAFEYVINNYPEITLHIDDNKHPTLAGTYLAACIFEITLFGKNPNTSTHIPIGLAKTTADNLRTAAWEFMQEWEESVGGTL